MSVKKIFPNDESANMTLEIKIEQDNAKAILVQTKNTQENQALIVEYMFGDTCDNSWEPFNWCCGQMQLLNPTNQLLIPPVPGNYRLVLVEFDGDGNILPYDELAFDEVEVQYRVIETNKDLSEYYKPCC